MRDLTKWFGVLMMLVVMCISTGWSAINSEPTDSCCQHEATNTDTKEKSCNNENNPFQFCSCCAHVWVPTFSISFEPLEYTTVAVFQLQGQKMLPLVHASDFWQPPRFS